MIAWCDSGDVRRVLRSIIPDSIDQVFADSDWESLIDMASRRALRAIRGRHDVSSIVLSNIPFDVRDLTAYMTADLYIRHNSLRTTAGIADTHEMIVSQIQLLQKEIMSGTIYYSDTGLPVPQRTNARVGGPPVPGNLREVYADGSRIGFADPV